MSPHDADALTGMGLWVIAGLPLLLALQQPGEHFGALCERARLLIALWLGGGLVLVGAGFLALLGFIAAVAFLTAVGATLNALDRARQRS